MRGIVVDKKDKYLIILGKNGQFIKVKNVYDAQIGSEIEVSTKPALKTVRFTGLMSAAAAFLILLGTLLTIYIYNLPYSYIDVDINPSIEITVNMFDRIIDVEGINEDGKKVVGSDNFRNMDIKEGIGVIVERAMNEGYIEPQREHVILFTVAAKNDVKVEGIQNQIKNALDMKLDNATVDTEIVIDAIPVEKFREVKEVIDTNITPGISPGKLNLIGKLKEVAPEINEEEYADKPVKDIMQKIKIAEAKGAGDKKSSNGDVAKNSVEENDGSGGSKSLKKSTGKNDKKDKDDNNRKEKDNNKEGKNNNKKEKDDIRKEKDNNKQEKDNNKKDKEYNKKEKDNDKKKNDSKDKENIGKPAENRTSKASGNNGLSGNLGNRKGEDDHLTNDRKDKSGTEKGDEKESKSKNQKDKDKNKNSQEKFEKNKGNNIKDKINDIRNWWNDKFGKVKINNKNDKGNYINEKDKNSKYNGKR